MAKIQGKRALGMDYGLARIGLAISDERKIIATPLMVLKTEKKTEETIKKLINELIKFKETHFYEIDEIIIGLPLMMSGKKGFVADEVLHFVELLKNMLNLPVITWDERLTTVQAERSMREGGLSRKKRAKTIDAVTAVLILQSYLDSRFILKNSIEAL